MPEQKQTSKKVNFLKLFNLTSTIVNFLINLNFNKLARLIFVI